MKRIKVTGVKTMGALVRYCGHKGVFIADIHHIAGAVVVRGNPNIEKVLSRSDSDYEAADYHLLDFPGPDLLESARRDLRRAEGQPEGGRA